jgi:hypothetical protein
MSLKADYIADLRAVPDGIAAFLTTAIPAPPAGLSQPATEEAANIMQGILAFYILQFFAPFAGLYPVELALRIGQHSNPIEAMCLAGLEYLSESQAANDFNVTEPVDGQAYAPGDLRVKCRVTNGTAKRMTASYQAGAEAGSVELTENNGVFEQYLPVRVVTEGEDPTPLPYTLTVVGNFAQKNSPDTTAITKTLTISISADMPEEGDLPLPPGGKDITALDNITAELADNLKKLASAVASKLPEDATALFEAIQSKLIVLDDVIAANTVPEAVKSLAEGTYLKMMDAATAALNALGTGGETSYEVAEDSTAAIAAGLNTLKALFEEYF